MSSTMTHDSLKSDTTLGSTFWNRHMPPVLKAMLFAVSGWVVITVVVDLKTDVAVLESRMERLEIGIQEIKADIQKILTELAGIKVLIQGNPSETATEKQKQLPVKSNLVNAPRQFHKRISTDRKKKAGNQSRLLNC